MEGDVQARIKAAQTVLADKYGLDLEDVVRFRHELHQYPEVGFKEFETKERLLKYLEARCGIHKDEVKNYAVTGFTYDIQGTAPPAGTKRTIGLRTDMDGLPLAELNTVEYKSVNKDVAHACGHDGHMAILSATANILMRFRRLIPSNKTIRLVYQPAEELDTGAKKMVDDGALDGLDEIYALHCAPYELGKVDCIVDGPCSASTVGFRISIQGKGSHGSFPENGKDPITALCHLQNAIQTIKSRNIGNSNVAVCSVCMLKAGQAENVIPDSSWMCGTIRTFKPEVEKQVMEVLEAMTTHIPAGLGCVGKLTFDKQSRAVVNAKVPGSEVKKAVIKVFGEDSTFADPMFGGEDFSYMAEKVPGAYIMVGCKAPEAELTVPHHPSFNFTDDIIAPCVLTWLRLCESRLDFLLPQ